MNAILASFLFFLLAFVLIGVFSYLKNRGDTSDYLMASQSISPLFVAMSAVSTNNSGYMFVGMIGFTYMAGLSSIWLMIGWILGDFIISLFVHKRLRDTTAARQSLSYPQVICEWNKTHYPVAQFILGSFTVLFLGIYAAAQLKAGGKALSFAFHWDYGVGVTIGAVIILMYCFAGGLRATIWTDVAQSAVMLLAMILLSIAAIHSEGGIIETLQDLRQVSPDYMSLFPPAINKGEYLALIVFIISWLFAGFGVVGQPHIMVRFMALKSSSLMWRTRYYYYAWYIVFYALTIFIGLMARLVFSEVDQFDPEIALLKIAQHQLPPVLIGAVLAGLFAATMSTADSQILSCTASATQDILRIKPKYYWITKLATVLITVIALVIAMYAHENVFQLVLIAWSGLGAVFVPLLIIYAFNRKLTQLQIILVSFTGFATTILWRKLGYDASVYEIMPGILAGLAMYALLCVFKRRGALS